MAVKNDKWCATGRRKSSVARVMMSKGSGKFLVNGRDFNEYFNRDTQKMVIKKPMDVLEIGKGYDIVVNVHGGGQTGQAGAIRLGLSRALEKINGDFRSTLKINGMLTRDSRQVERKKYGQPGARKKFQFSKR